MALLGGVLFLLLVSGGRARGLLCVTTQVVATALVIAVPLGGALAVLITKTNAPGRQAAKWALAALLFLPLYLHTAAWDAAIGQLGWWTQSRSATAPVDPLLAGWLGAGWLHGLAAVPWVALIVGAALRSVDRAHEEGALLDTSPLGVLSRVTLRNAAAAGGVAAAWVAVLVASEMTVTDLLQVRTFAEEIYTQAVAGAFEPRSGVPTTLGARPLLAGVALLALLGAAALIAARRWIIIDDRGDAGHWRWRLRTTRPLAAVLLWLPVGLLVAAPVLNLAHQAGVTAERTGDGWTRGWSAAELASAVAGAPWLYRWDLLLTARLGVYVATGATLLGVFAAWWLSRSPRIAWPACGVMAVCLVTPGPLLGVATIRLLNHPWDSPLSPLTWLYDHTLLAPWLVQMVRATPIATLILWPTLASIPEGVLAAARTDGVGPVGVLLRVAAPLRWRAIATAWLAALAVSVGELAATNLVLPPGADTLAKRVFRLLHSGVEGNLAGLCLSGFAFFFAAAAVAAWLMHRPSPSTARESPR